MTLLAHFLLYLGLWMGIIFPIAILIGQCIRIGND